VIETPNQLKPTKSTKEKQVGKKKEKKGTQESHKGINEMVSARG